MSKYIYLVNRFNLREKTDEIIQKLHHASKELERDYRIIVNASPAEAADFVTGLRDKEFVVTGIGGDGSINHLLNDLAGTRNTLAFIPIGTGNDFYRGCLENLEDGVHAVDLIRINDRYFINVACFGIDADIANDDRFIHNRFIPRPLRYHAGVACHFLTFRGGRRMKIEYEEKDGSCLRSVEGEFTTVVAANNRYYGGGYKVSPKSRIDDGLMEVLIVDGLGKISIARILLSMKKAGHLNHPALHQVRTRHLRITAGQPFCANIDGEPLLSDHFDLELLPKACRIELDREFIQKVCLL